MFQMLNQNGSKLQSNNTSNHTNSTYRHQLNPYRGYVNMDLTAQDRVNMNGVIDTKPPVYSNGASPAHRPFKLQLSQSTPNTPTHGRQGGEVVTSPGGSTASTGSASSAAASFFARSVHALRYTSLFVIMQL